MYIRARGAAGYNCAVNTDASGVTSPLVSVVVPTFNRTRFLADALASALQQTYTVIEILVADDASTEDVRGAVVSRFSDPPDGPVPVHVAPYVHPERGRKR